MCEMTKMLITPCPTFYSYLLVLAPNSLLCAVHPPPPPVLAAQCRVVLPELILPVEKATNTDNL